MMILSDKSEVESCRCKNISEKEISNYEKKIIPEMKILMYQKFGIGLAAPQVGINRTFFVMKYGNEIISCYNPSWKPKSNKRAMSTEGCLTYPRSMQNTQLRYKIIIARFTDSTGIVQELKLRGMDAVVFQHESDHLIGKTIFFDPKEDKL